MNISIKYAEGLRGVDTIILAPHCDLDAFKLGIIFAKHNCEASYVTGGSGFKHIAITKPELINALLGNAATFIPL